MPQQLTEVIMGEGLANIEELTEEVLVLEHMVHEVWCRWRECLEMAQEQ